MNKSRITEAMKERRRYIRNLVKARVSISHGSFGTLLATTMNISDGGVLVHLLESRKIPEGSHLQVKMLESMNTDITFNMKVIRSEGYIMGMQFIDYELQGERHKIGELINELSKP